MPEAPFSSFRHNFFQIYEVRGKQWLSELPKLIHTIAKQWDLKNLKPLLNLSYNYVMSGQQNGKPIILKLALDYQTLSQEVSALKAFAEYGGIAVLDHLNNAVLLQQAQPGYSLKTYLPKQHKKALHIACCTMERLHTSPLLQHEKFPHIQEWFSLLDREWDIPELYLQRARNIKNRLLKLEKEKTLSLLHGDLHHENILAHEND